MVPYSDFIFILKCTHIIIKVISTRNEASLGLFGLPLLCLGLGSVWYASGKIDSSVKLTYGSLFKMTNPSSSLMYV